MNMNLKITNIILIGLIIITIVIGILSYSSLPKMIPSHWNINGNIDGYMPKFWGLFLYPLVIIFMYALFLIIPRIDPLKKNISKFRNTFNNFIIIISLFFVYLFFITLKSVTTKINIINYIIPAIAIIIYYSGILIKKAKQNWFIGIRTPWTLSNKEVWNKTHTLGSKLFKISAIIIILSLFFKKISMVIFITVILIAAITPIIYSYFIFKKLGK